MKIDNVGFPDPKYWTSMDEEQAVAKMKADGILATHGKTEEWAARAYELLCAEAAKPPVQPKKRQR